MPVKSPSIFHIPYSIFYILYSKFYILYSIFYIPNSTFLPLTPAIPSYPSMKNSNDTVPVSMASWSKLFSINLTVPSLLYNSTVEQRVP